MNERIKKVAFITNLLLLMCVIQGCGRATYSTKESALKSLHPSVLYLDNDPNQEIYVEVDSIEGCVVPESYLQAIRSFLSLHCSEAKSIKIVQDAPFKPSDKKLPIEYISLLCQDGPIGVSNNSAYMHVLFYNAKQGNPSISKNPRVLSYFPTCVYFNTSWVKHDIKAQLHAIRHELGHVLGLCSNHNSNKNTHCKKKCLMQACVDDGILTPPLKLLGLSNKGAGLCKDCFSEIERRKTEERATNLRFSGPFFVRDEESYSVAIMPMSYVIIPSEFADDFDWKKSLSQIKERLRDKVGRLSSKEAKKNLKKKQMTIFVALYNAENEITFTMIEDDVLLQKMQSDPIPIIKALATGSLEV